ncbi:MAG: ABC transporter permease [Phycisphaerales bacterium]
MTAALTIALREARSFFRVPLGWVVMALYLFLTGVVFAERTLLPGEPASLRYLFSVSGFLLLPVAPAISMRLLSDELRAGTIEPLLTAPVRDAEIILGKFLGGLFFLLALVAPTLIHAAILHVVSDPKPDPGPIAAGYLSLVLLGGLYLAVGTFFSSLTSSQTLAFLATFLFLLAALLGTSDLVSAPAPVDRWLASLAIGPRLADLGRGVIDTSHLAFFLTGIALFLVLAHVSLQSRRWR